MNYFAIALLAVTAGYLFHIGVIPSISDTYRTIKDKRIYHAFFFVSAVLIACQGVYSERLEIPYVIAGFFFYALSLAAAFWKTDEGWLHVLCTYTAIITGMTLTVVRIWPVWGFYSIGLVVAAILLALWGDYIFRKNTTYWIEVCCYVLIFGPIIKL